METKYWTTKDGQKIKISDMTDSHLTNAIRFWLKSATIQLNRDIDMGYMALSTMQGEMAIESMDSGIYQLEHMSALEYAMDSPKFVSLLKEARKRKLPIEKELQ